MTLVDVATYKELWLLDIPEKHFNMFSLRCYSLGPRKCVIENHPAVDSNIHFLSLPVKCVCTGNTA